MIFNIVLAVHVLVCIVLIIVVLMQSSKGGGLAGAFGGGGDQTVFGGHETATFLSRATTYLAVLFMTLSLLLSFLSANRRGEQRESVIQRTLQREGNVIPSGQSIDDILGTTGQDSVTVPPDTGQ